MEDQANSLREGRMAENEENRNTRQDAVRCIAVASGKGGVGKTFMTVNLSCAFQQHGLKVLLVDADLGLANADTILGKRPELTLQDAVFDNHDLSEIVTNTPQGVDLIAAASGERDMVSMAKTRVEMLAGELLRFATNYDVVLFDCASGIDSNVTTFIQFASQTLLVTTPEPAALLDVYALLKVIHLENISDNVGLVVNNVTEERDGSQLINTLTKVSENYLSIAPRPFGMVPATDLASKAMRAHKPLLAYDTDNPAAENINKVAEEILKKEPSSLERSETGDTQLLADGLMEI